MAEEKKVEASVFFLLLSLLQQGENEAISTLLSLNPPHCRESWSDLA